MRSVDEGLDKASITVPGDDHFDLHNWPFYWITKTNGKYLASVEQSLKAIELDVPRWRVLMLLEGHRGRSVSYLANEAATKLPTMTRIVQRMQADGLVTSRPRQTDQRVTEVLLTGNGRRARVLALQHADKIYAKAFEGLTAGMIEELNRSLAKIHANLSTI